MTRGTLRKPTAGTATAAATALDTAPDISIHPGSRAELKELSDNALLAKIRALNEIAARRGQSLAQMAIAWTLRDPRVTSALPGASSVQQVEENVGAIDRLDFSPEELVEIDRHATESGINLWAASSAV